MSKKGEELLRENSKVLVAKAKELAETLAKNKKDTKSVTQLRNLLEVVQAASCPEEVELYLNYVKAKKGTKDFWEKTAEEAKRKLNEITNLVKERTKGMNLSGEEKDELIKKHYEKFVGYLIWQYTYLAAS
ncbi:MAG: hypothetical protein PWQ91_527 [Eubacteriales bacterium]|nr:hypothetical protein [Eubacteriales bacterium]